MRHTVRYGGIEPPPVSHERQAAFVSVYRIEAARNVKREQKPANLKGGKGKCQEGTRFGGCVASVSPLSAEPLISMIMLYVEHCKGIKGAS